MKYTKSNACGHMINYEVTGSAVTLLESKTGKNDEKEI